jgi:hypothetical protein
VRHFGVVGLVGSRGRGDIDASRITLSHSRIRCRAVLSARCQPVGCRVVPMRHRSTPAPTHHGKRGLNLNDVGFLGGDVIVAGYREICEVLFPRPVSADEVRLQHVVIPLYLQLISPPNGLQEMLPTGA